MHAHQLLVRAAAATTAAATILPLLLLFLLKHSLLFTRYHHVVGFDVLDADAAACRCMRPICVPCMPTGWAD